MHNHFNRVSPHFLKNFLFWQVSHTLCAHQPFKFSQCLKCVWGVFCIPNPPSNLAHMHMQPLSHTHMHSTKVPWLRIKRDRVHKNSGSKLGGWSKLGHWIGFEEASNAHWIYWPNKHKPLVFPPGVSVCHILFICNTFLSLCVSLLLQSPQFLVNESLPDLCCSYIFPKWIPSI